MFLLLVCVIVLWILVCLCTRLTGSIVIIWIWSFLCLIAAAVMVLIILYMTVLTRNSSEHKIILIPFYSFYEARKQPEYYRSMLMNVFLFEPLGLTLPYGLSWFEIKLLCHREQREFDDVWIRFFRFARNRYQIAKYSILFCLSLSSTIEFCQGVLSRGRVEIDDVFMNLLGALIGVVTYIICGFIKI